MAYGNYPDLSHVQRILVVKLRHLGDVLLTSPVFTHLKAALPKASIDAYIYEEAKPMLEGHPAIAALIGYDRKWKDLPWYRRWGQEIALLWQLRKRKYDMVINLTEGDRGALVCKISGAKICVGFPPKGKWQKKWITHLVKHCPTLRHTVERQLDALRRIGIFPGDDRDLVWNLPSVVMEKIQQKVGARPFVLIHPTSRWKFKCYPVDKMRACVNALCQKGERIILTSGGDEDEIQMVRAIADGLDVEVWAGLTTLQELGALIALSSVVVCVDSVPFHMTSALKKKVVAIFGPTSDVTWGPWNNPDATVLTEPMSCRPCYQDGCGGSKQSDCLRAIPVARVLKAISKHLP